jgi:hypothetical protein
VPVSGLESSVPPGLVTTAFDKQASSAVISENDTVVKRPEPDGITSPVHENPKTVEAPAATLNPASSAAPPGPR